MQALSAQFDLAAFYRRLGAARQRVLMLDYDGTLAPFNIRPERAVPYHGVAELLESLMEQGDTRVVIISGRRAAEVAALLPLDPRPEIWGAHGWERISTAGETRLEAPDAATSEALARARSRAVAFKGSGGRLERKPGSIALHWRGLTPLAVARLRQQALSAWEPLTHDGPLEWLPFDGGIELRARGTNKQHAVMAVLSETGPDGVAAYLGDDVTDEDAFRAMQGRGLAVLVRPEYRRTAADLWIRPPEELLEFLGRWRTT